jgi:hypothetical protein
MSDDGLQMQDYQHVISKPDDDNDFVCRLDQNGNNSSKFDEKNSSQIKKDLDKEINENILGVFVVSFDTRVGNTIEWQIPETIDLKHVEFKAMASGFHLIQRDLVYFHLSNNEAYGLSAFESLKTDKSSERYIKMKSVGIVAKSYTFLKKLTTFLRNQVR